MPDSYLLKVNDDLVSLLRNLHPLIKMQIRSAIKLLAQTPNAGKALKDDLLGLRSYRVKRYRIIYRIISQQKILEIIAIGPRRNIYEQTFRIISKEQAKN